MIELIRYSGDKKNNWDDLVAKSKNGVFLFYRNYLDYHKEIFIDHSLIIYKKSKIIALFPANEQNTEICSHAGLTFGSLIMNNRLRAIEVIEIFDLIKKYYLDLGFKKIIYKAIPSIFHKYPADEDLYALFKLDAKLIRRDISSVIKIKESIRFSETKRQAVSKSIKTDIVFCENQNFSQYWDLLNEVLSKFSAKPVHSLEEINELKKFFPEKIKLFEARQNNVLLAGIVIYDYDNVVHTQYMANSLEGRKIGALDFIDRKSVV